MLDGLLPRGASLGGTTRYQTPIFHRVARLRISSDNQIREYRQSDRLLIHRIYVPFPFCACYGTGMSRHNRRVLSARDRHRIVQVLVEAHDAINEVRATANPNCELMARCDYAADGNTRLIKELTGIDEPFWTGAFKPDR